MSSMCIQCIMRSHDRKHDYFLILLILIFKFKREKLSLSTVTEWSNAQFKFKLKQIYIFTSISLKLSSFKQIGLINSTFWRQWRCWKSYVWRWWQTKMINVRLLAVFFQSFMFENDNIFTSRLQDHCCYSSCDVCCRVLEKWVKSEVFDVCRWCKHRD